MEPLVLSIIEDSTFVCENGAKSSCDDITEGSDCECYGEACDCDNSPPCDADTY